MRELEIGKNEAGQRLDKFLGKYMRLAGKGFLYKMMRKKNITLNGKRCEGGEKLEEGDVVRLFLSEETIDKFSDKEILKSFQDSSLNKASGKLEILYEDPDILLLNKPAGVLSQGDGKGEESLVEMLIGYLLESGSLSREELGSFRPSVCNRLDRNTSGIVSAGKTLAGLQFLSEVFRDRTIHKDYQCIVAGEIRKTKTIEGWLVKDEKANKVSVFKEQRPGGVPIRTRYEPLAVHDGHSLLKVRLYTGRSHQIRAHLASIGHPIVGDRKYGGERGFPHQLLHSFRLEFPACSGRFSYLSGKVFEAPLPEEFQAAIRKWNLETV